MGGDPREIRSVSGQTGRNTATHEGILVGFAFSPSHGDARPFAALRGQ